MLRAASQGAYLFVGFSVLVACGGVLRRSRIGPNEGTVLENLQTMLSAQAAYKNAAFGGYAPTVTCLMRPTDCIKDYPGRPFLDETFPQGFGGGQDLAYIYEMHPGSTASPMPPGLAVGSVSSFAYVAVPRDPGESGVRAFCADSTGLICFSPQGQAPPVRDGACPIDSTLCFVSAVTRRRP